MDMLKYFDQFPQWGAVGMILVLVGLALLGRQITVLRHDGADQSDLLTEEQLRRRLIERGVEVFGSLSIVERDEHQRALAREIVGIADFLVLDDKVHEYDICRFYKDLLGVISVESKPRGTYARLRDRLMYATGRPLEEFDPPFLKSWYSALAGVTWIAEGQSPERARHALPLLDVADQQLKRDYPEMRVSVIVNVRGIANAILMRDSSRPDVERIQHAIDAHRDFVSTLKIRQTLGDSDGERNSYRFYANHAEWCADVYHLWMELSSDNKIELHRALSTYMKSNGAQELLLFDSEREVPDTEQILSTLFRSGLRAIEEGLKLAHDPKLGRHRPAIHHSAVLLGISYARSQSGQHSVSSIVSGFSLNDDDLVKHLQQAVDLWRREYSPERTLRNLRDNSILERWKACAPSFAGELDAIVDQLETESPADQILT